MSGTDGSSGTAAPPQNPPFGGEDVIVRLNEWAARVDQRLDALQQGVEEAKGGAAVSVAQLQAEVQALENKVMTSLQQVTDGGVAALTQVIDGFRVELGKHEYAHNLARSGIEQVVAQATVKFQDVERAVVAGQSQTEGAVQQLRTLMQTELLALEARLEGRFAGPAASAAAAAPPIPHPAGAAAAAGAAGPSPPPGVASDPLQSPSGDPWASAAPLRADGSSPGGGSPGRRCSSSRPGRSR